MGGDVPELPLPKSYHALPFTQIRISHHPSTSTSVTPILVLTLSRPEKYNAFTPVMMRELEQAYQLFDIDDRVKCIVVTGHGKMFCAGADLDTGFVRSDETSRVHRDGGGRVVLATHRCRKPVIGAVQGSAVGVGITMTLPMTIRIAWRDAKIGFVFARRGLVMEAASSFFLPRLVGMSKALHLVTTGSVYPASHPLLNPLFSEILSTQSAVLPRALELAEEVVANTSIVSTYLMRELMYRNPGSAEATHLLDSRILFDSFGSRDNLEGTKAFLEKRAVKFEGTMQNDAPAAWPWWDPIDTGNRPVVEGYAERMKRSKDGKAKL